MVMLTAFRDNPVCFLILANGGAEPIIVILFLVIAGIINLIRWLASKGEENRRKRGMPTSRSRQTSTQATRPSPQGDPGEVLKKFLEEMTGVPVQRQAQRPKPQQPPAPPRRPTRVSRPAPVTPPAPPPAPERIHTEPEVSTEPSLVTLGKSPEYRRTQDELPSEKKPQPKKKPKKARVPRVARKRKQPVAAYAWMQQLPEHPLQRGIVLSEILGPPCARKRAFPR